METKKDKIDEKQLEDVVGGWSKNRYDPKHCAGLSKPDVECLGGLFKPFPCDHYIVKEIPYPEDINRSKYEMSCAMGGFATYTEVRG